MRIRDLAAIVTAALATHVVPASAQRTGDQARLVFTVSGAYVSGTGLWHVPDQPVRGGSFDLSRGIAGRLGGGMAATYYRGDYLGLTADVFAFELAYGDGCRQVRRADTLNTLACNEIDEAETGAMAAVISLGAIFRVASREVVSPFARVSAGILISNQSSIETSGTAAIPGAPGGTPPELIPVYTDSRKSRVGPAFAIGVGTTTPIGRGFQFRWEVRDNIVGIQQVTGPTAEGDFDPPHGVGFKHLFSVIAGVDLVLERKPGRRY